RLILGPIREYSEDEIKQILKQVNEEGNEGLVIHSDKFNVKVKPKYTYDVKILEIIPGRGKHEGNMGALLTEKGKVGTGFTDLERRLFNDPSVVGSIIEVECMELTKNGKFRHARYIRQR